MTYGLETALSILTCGSLCLAVRYLLIRRQGDDR